LHSALKILKSWYFFLKKRRGREKEEKRKRGGVYILRGWLVWPTCVKGRDRRGVFPRAACDDLTAPRGAG
jgi:hypothetical protein